jgi:hypothetical protein
MTTHFLLVTHTHTPYLIYHFSQRAPAKNAHFAFAIWMFGGGDKAVRTPFARPSAPFYGRGLSRQVITQPCAPLTKSYGAIWKCYVCIWAGEAEYLRCMRAAPNRNYVTLASCN